MRARGLHFRPIESQAQLESLSRELESQASSSPLQQGLIWLASRIQIDAIEHLLSDVGRERVVQLLDGVESRRAFILKPLGKSDQLTLDRIEAVLSAYVREVLGDRVERELLQVTALAGKLLEIVRMNVHKLPDIGSTEKNLTEDQSAAHLEGILTEPVRTAELNEARVRYARLGDEEKNKRYNEFRRRLTRLIVHVAPFAPSGLEPFCQAVEAALYPYPERLEFIRTFARNIYNTGNQSSLFTETTTPQSVNQRYDTLKENKQANPLILELAKGFALGGFQESNLEEKKEFMAQLDLKTEFDWPTNLSELKLAMHTKRR